MKMEKMRMEDGGWWGGKSSMAQDPSSREIPRSKVRTDCGAFPSFSVQWFVSFMADWLSVKRSPSPRPNGFPSPPQVSFPRGDVRFANRGPVLGRGSSFERHWLAEGLCHGVRVNMLVCRKDAPLPRERGVRGRAGAGRPCQGSAEERGTCAESVRRAREVRRDQIAATERLWNRNGIKRLRKEGMDNRR